jgi:tRNA-Thr(GGU) m(6)t(6)A37 methyltransferase TsaA
MPIYAFEERRPTIAATAYLAPSALIIGRVIIGERCYIGHGVILRGDYGTIEIGEETAVEEGVIVHARPSDFTRIGRRVTLGHGAMVHNAVIHDGAVIGMRAVVSDYSEVGEGAIVGELGLVKNGQKVPPRKVAVGVPVRVLGDVDERHRAMTHWAKDLYVDLAARYAGGAMTELAPTQGPEGWRASFTAIGTIHSPIQSAEGAPIQGGLGRQIEGEVHLDPAFAEGLADLEGFSHVVLLYAFHRSSGYRLKVTPYLDTTPRGLFATRAPRRPNPIGLTVVELLGIEGCTLRVRGLDVLDGTPLLDLKPHVPAFDGIAAPRIGWLEPRLRELELAGALPPGADDRFAKE